MNNAKRFIRIWLLVFCLLLSGCIDVSTLKGDAGASKKSETIKETEQTESVRITESLEVTDVPEYSGSPYILINDNVPDFTEDELITTSFESYSNLDELDRCGIAYADIGTDLMPTEKRSPLGKVKPSGWHSVEYDIVDGESLYNRCHLIGYQLTAENANEKNLITGTRYLNIEGMLPFENMVTDYIKETENHVLYRVTPLFEDDNLVASGVQMEAMSVEDEGEGVLFNVYCYNVQPGISIDYATGESQLNDEADGYEGNDEEENGAIYILNTNTHKFHKTSCSSVKQINEANVSEYCGDRDELNVMGYEPCKRCDP